MMRYFVKNSLKLTACLSLVIGLSGCITTAVVGGAAVATKVATDPRSAGRQIDDETLEEKVAYNLNKDGQLKEEGRINVVAYHGHVLLIGQVRSDYAKEQANSIAAGVDGVVRVLNEIRLGEKIGAAQIAQDSWLTTKVKSKLLGSASVKASEVKVISENNEVFLLGSLSVAQMDAATQVARETNGVRRIVRVAVSPRTGY